MLLNPYLNQKVLIRYGPRRNPITKKRERPPMPLHDKIGIVRRRTGGNLVGKIVDGQKVRRPRNHLVEVGGKLYVIPCGHLMRAPRPGRRKDTLDYPSESGYWWIIFERKYAKPVCELISWDESRRWEFVWCKTGEKGYLPPKGSDYLLRAQYKKADIKPPS